MANWDQEKEETTAFSKTEIDSIPVPLPNEIPEPPQLSELPKDILHSGTVETLIGQNDDLMSRLKVTIRRQSLLEQKIIELKDRNLEVQDHADNIFHQNQILREKDKQASKRFIELEQNHSKLKEELQLYEIRYSELSDQMDQRKQSLAKLQDTSKKLLSSFKRYQRRIKRWVRPLIRSLQNELKDLKAKIQLLDQSLIDEQMRRSELKDKNLQLAEHIENKEKQHQQQISALTNSYEQKIEENIKGTEELNAELNSIRESLEIFKKKAEEASFLANENIRLKRHLDELGLRSQENIESIQSQLNSYRSEAKSSSIEIDHLREELNQSRDERQFLKDENDRLQDQLESLQILWNEKQKESKDLVGKYQRLQSINRELAGKLKSQSVGDARGDSLEGAHEELSDRVKNVRKAQQSMQKIEGLIAEIQSGIPPKPQP